MTRATQSLRGIITAGLVLVATTALGAGNAVSASPADSIADLAGTWKLSYVGPDGVQAEPTLTITVKDGKAGGEMATKLYGTFEIENVTLEDDVLRFEIDDELDGMDMFVTYRAEIDGDTLEGTFEYEVGDSTGSVDFEGKKEEKGLTPEDLIGTWQIEIESPQQTFEPVLTLSKEGKGLKGVYDGQMGETTIDRIKLSGSKLLFEFSVEVDGQDLAIFYEMVVSEDKNSMTGEVTFEFGGDSGSLEAKAKREKDL